MARSINDDCRKRIGDTNLDSGVREAMNGKHVFDGIIIDRDDGPMIQESVYWTLWISTRVVL